MNLLELKNINKSFGGRKIVDDLTIIFSKGKITSLIGPNGAGKTTIFNLITGFLRPDKGKILYNSQEINLMPPWEIANIGIGRLFQDVRVFDRLTVIENVLLAKKNPSGENPLLAIFYNRKIKQTEKENIEDAMQWINFVGLEEKIKAPAGSLSYGQQKLLSIARLLAGGTELLLLDEPTAGLNPVMIKKILGLIKELSAKGKTIVIIEHNMKFVLEISNWVFFLDNGKIAYFGLPGDVLENPEVMEAYMGV